MNAKCVDLVTVTELDGDAWWEDGAMRLLAEYAASGHPFTSADLRSSKDWTEPEQPSYIGSLFAKAQRLGLIRKLGYTSTRVGRRNGGMLAQWQGVAA